MRVYISKTNDDLIRLAIFTLIITMLYLFILSPVGLLKNGYFVFYDVVTKYAHRVFYNNQKNSNITIIAIDDTSLRKENLKWPWTRQKFGQIVSTISKYSPKAIGIDITYVGKSTYGTEDDDAFAKSMKDAGNVILSSYIGDENKWVLPYEQLRENAKATGFVSRPMDRNAIVRQAQPIALYKGEIDYSFEAKLAAIFSNIDFDRLRLLGRNLFIDNIKIPLNYDVTFLVKYKHIFHNFNVISVSDIYENNFDKSLIKDRIVMIGATSVAIHDIFSTPLGSMPGVMINANAIDNIIKAEILQKIPVFYEFFYLLILALIVALVTFRQSFLLSLSITIGFLTTIFFVSIYAFKYNFVIDVFGAFFVLTLSFVISRAYLSIKNYLENSKLLKLLITDQDTGLPNIYYLLNKMRLLVDNAKGLKRIPSLLLIQIIDKENLLSVLNSDAKKEIMNDVYSVTKNKLSGMNPIIVKTDDYQFGILLPTYDYKKIKDVVELLYKKLNGFEIILSKEKKKYPIFSAIGYCFGNNMDEISSEVMLRASQEALGKALSLSTNKVSEFDFEKGKIAVKSEEKIPYKKGGLVDFVLNDLRDKNRQLSKQLQELYYEVIKLKESYVTAVFSLVKALEEKDVYTAGHSERVAAYSVNLCMELNLPEVYIDTVRKAALLHDIGKIAIPDNILRKKDELTDEEREQVKKHPLESIRILEPAQFLSETHPLILHHHERYDGRGYPHGLSGERIPLGARIISIADAYDAITSGRTYNISKQTNDAVLALQADSGKHFDPAIVKKFIEMIKRDTKF